MADVSLMGNNGAARYRIRLLILLQESNAQGYFMTRSSHVDQPQGDLPRIARHKPYYYKLVPGKKYAWCACGLSKRQPFCDGSHAGTSFEPVMYRATDTDGEVLFCGCKQSAEKPFCDGAHNNLSSTYPDDDPSSPANLDIPAVKYDRHGLLELNGRCYVGKVGKITPNFVGSLQWRTLIAQETGAIHQSLFHFEIGSGRSPVVSFGDRNVVILVSSGEGRIDICGREFPVEAESGICVRPGEAFAIENDASAPISLFVAVCPHASAPHFPGTMNGDFDSEYEQRTVLFDPEKRQSMGDRTFQVLVNSEVGSELVTQFIGDIPLSKAVPHRHLYEESLVVIKGKGCMWTEDIKANVNTGDIIFLPAKQLHSLQCTDPDGMVVAGVIYPSGNPDINF
jgi:CDGSH-type Zn-finger protein/quercetin dioxygenase-like cupin family protein